MKNAGCYFYPTARIKDGQPFRFNLKGKMFGSLYVRKYAGKAEDGTSLWECRCYRDGCFKVLNVRTQSLLSGASKGCGCGSVTHGLTRGPKGGDKPTEYKSWIHAKLRCFNPDNLAYKDYGGRGITMCAGWRDDFAAFFRDMGTKPPGTSLDRNDNNGHYSCGHCPECHSHGWPANCRWATPKVQASHRRNTIVVKHNGREQTLASWAEELGIKYGILHHRLFHRRMPVGVAFAKKKLTKPLPGVTQHAGSVTGCQPEVMG